MAATLNQDDIKLLKSVFATKTDLVAMEKRQDTKYATKNDLSAMEKRQNAKYATKSDLKRFATKDDLKPFATKDYIDKRFDDLDAALVKYSKDIEFRISRLENTVGITTAN